MHSRWVFLPVLGAPIAHAPVLRLDLLRALKRPIDAGRTVRGRRVFGDNKTWRGALVMFGGVLGATLGLWRWRWYRSRLPAELQDVSAVSVGALLGAGVVVGELPNSFLKRQLAIPPGAHRRSGGGAALSVLDQADFVLATWLLLLPVYRMSTRQLADVFLTVSLVHLPINVIGYAIGARTTAI